MKNFLNWKTLLKKLNCNLAQLAIEWVVVNPDCNTTILWASKVSQLEETVEAVEIYKKFDKDIILEIEKIFGNVPKKVK